VVGRDQLELRQAIQPSLEVVLRQVEMRAVVDQVSRDERAATQADLHGAIKKQSSATT
jgi:hypothetical protein